MCLYLLAVCPYSKFASQKTVKTRFFSFFFCYCDYLFVNSIFLFPATFKKHLDFADIINALIYGQTDRHVFNQNSILLEEYLKIELPPWPYNRTMNIWMFFLDITLRCLITYSDVVLFRSHIFYVWRYQPNLKSVTN